MSGQSQVPFKKYIDPRLNLNQTQQFSSVESANLINTTEFSLSEAQLSGNSAISLTCNPPNRNNVISRCVRKIVKYNVQLTFQTAPANNVLILPNFAAAPSYMPISRTTLNEDITIGNQNISNSNSHIVRETMCRYLDDSLYTGTTSMNDTYLRFSDVTNSNRSALAPYGDTAGGQFGNQESRNSYYNYNGNELKGDGVSTVFNVQFEVNEPLMISPFVFGEHRDNAVGIFGVDSMQYNCTFGNLNNAFNIDSSVTLTPPLVTVAPVVTIQRFALRFQYLSPQSTYSMPPNMFWSYYQPNVRTAGFETIADGGTLLGRQTFSLSGIPRRMYICARDTDTTGTKPLRHLALVENTLSVQINGYNTVKSRSNNQLYDMCKDNGLNITFSQFNKYCGSVICLDFGKGNCALSPEQVAGLSQKNTFEVNADFKNLSGEPIEAQYTVIWVFNGIFRMDDGATSVQINPLTESTVISQQASTNLHVDLDPDDVYGGSLWSGLKSVGKDLVQCALEKKALSRVLGEVNTPDFVRNIASDVETRYGSGLEQMQGGRMMSRGMLRNRY